MDNKTLSTNALEAGQNQNPGPDLNCILDPEKTSLEELEVFFADLEEELNYKEVIKIIDEFVCSEDYKKKYPQHYEKLIVHNAIANMELKTSESVEKAKVLFKQAISLFPDSSNTYKYFSYAELVKGEESLELYKKGLALIQNQMKSLLELQSDYEATMNTTDIDISCETKPVITKEEYEASKTSVTKLEEVQMGVFTAMGEIYITDLLEDPNSLETATVCAEKAFALGENLETLLLSFNIYSIQVARKDPNAYPNALLNARKAVRGMTMQLLSKPISEVDISIVVKCADAAISINSFMESFSIISELEKSTGCNHEMLLWLWTNHHHSSAVYHLKGFHHYSGRLTEVINGLELSHEGSTETGDIKGWVEELKEKTRSSIITGDEVENDDTFIEMTSAASVMGSGSIQEVTISDSEQSVNGDDEEELEVFQEEVDDFDDSCVIIEDGGVITSSQEDENQPAPELQQTHKTADKSKVNGEPTEAQEEEL